MPNRLADASSLYLRQHADNPVDWHPWDEEALARARREDKPILLSIGYSACHWCHVMAHESFEDPDTAAVMNELFVNIKVDREERPDLDRIYQLAHQLLAQRPGGWPLTVFLTPGDRMPFFAGTYFPRLPRHGLPAFVDVLRQIAAFYHERRADLERQNAALAEVYRRIEAAGAAADGMPERATLDRARQLLEAEFDPRHGGFGGAPKFPQPAALGLFMRLGRRGDRPAGRMALFSLEQMRQGGLYDQLGGGFFRYCVDADWTVPHFEKMLYDNGALLPLYAEAARATGLETLREAVRDTAGWLLREMRLPGGAFAASLDADSPGGEGAYYLWTPDELRARLPEAEYAVAARHYGLENPANFEGRWHLLARQSPAATAEALGLAEAEVRRRLQRARARLLAARAARPAPGRDAKVLTAWNALAIGGLARAARLLEDDALLPPAEAAAGFLHTQAWRAGRLYAVWAAGAPRQPAFLDDAAFLLEALLELLQARWDPRWLDWARELAELLLNEFADTQGGGFFFTAADHEALIHRPKSFADESLPAGNAVAAGALLRLGWLLGETRYLEAAEATLRAGAAAGLDRAPQAHCRLLLVLEDFLAPPPVVILRAEAARLRDWRARIPPESGAEVYAIPVTAAELPGALAGRAPRGDGVAYLCRGTHCAPPVTDPAELEQALRASA